MGDTERKRSMSRIIRCGDIGVPRRQIEFEPLPEHEPIKEPSPAIEPAEVPEPAGAR